MVKGPNVDLHRHLDGNIRVSTIFDLSQKHDIKLGVNTIEELLALVLINDKTTDLLAFIQKLDIGVSILKDLNACHRVAYENVIDAYSEGLDYIELRFSPAYMAKAHGLPLEGVVEAVMSGFKTGIAETNMPAALIGILTRSYGSGACFKELNSILWGANLNNSPIVGVDLAGDEKAFPAKLFVDHFKQAKEAGLAITVHAGEADSAQSIWDAITLLGASRIGHGVNAIYDKPLIDLIGEREIGIEACILSNYQTGAWTNIESHPVKSFLAHGLDVFLNTDDPGISNNTLDSEYKLAKNQIGLNQKQLQTLKFNALKQAFGDVTGIAKHYVNNKKANK